jgi:WhiB family redox-sensing transcriptional regulator
MDILALSDNLSDDLTSDVTYTETAVDPAWRSRARCADGNGTMTPLFFSEDLHDIARAKAICAKCPVTKPCLTEALESHEPWGVWGGQLIVNGRILAAKRRRGRPAKHGRTACDLPLVDEDGRDLVLTA